MQLVHVSEIISQSQKAYLDYLRAQETEITRREMAIARIDAIEQQLKSNHTIKKQIANQFFAERRQLKKYADMALDKAIAIGDDKMASCALQFMEVLYNKDFFALQNAATKNEGE